MNEEKILRVIPLIQNYLIGYEFDYFREVPVPITSRLHYLIIKTGDYSYLRL